MGSGSCRHCVRKHLSCVLVLLDELERYPSHRWLIAGHLHEAWREGQGGGPSDTALSDTALSQLINWRLIMLDPTDNHIMGLADFIFEILEGDSDASTSE